MPKKTVVSFNSIGFCLGLHQQLFWHKLIISLPIVSTNNTISDMLKNCNYYSLSNKLAYKNLLLKQNE
jgi:hypothetical protein